MRLSVIIKVAIEISKAIISNDLHLPIIYNIPKQSVPDTRLPETIFLVVIEC